MSGRTHFSYVESCALYVERRRSNIRRRCSARQHRAQNQPTTDFEKSALHHHASKQPSVRHQRYPISWRLEDQHVRYPHRLVDWVTWQVSTEKNWNKTSYFCRNVNGGNPFFSCKKRHTCLAWLLNLQVVFVTALNWKSFLFRMLFACVD